MHNMQQTRVSTWTEPVFHWMPTQSKRASTGTSYGVQGVKLWIFRLLDVNALQFFTLVSSVPRAVRGGFDIHVVVAHDHVEAS